jgi:hypothetical protein
VSSKETGGRGSGPREPAWDEKVLLLSAAFERHGLAYAFGGAIALNYHREPRATLDIDVNVFLAPAHEAPVLDALGDVYLRADAECLREELTREGQTRSRWGDTYIDIFLANTGFHEAMAQRIERQPFGETEIPVLSIEDLLICKILFDRQKDWLDFEAVLEADGARIDRAYIVAWLGRFLDPADGRLQRALALLQAARP